MQTRQSADVVEQIDHTKSTSVPLGRRNQHNVQMFSYVDNDTRFLIAALVDAEKRFRSTPPSSTDDFREPSERRKERERKGAESSLKFSS